MIVFVVWARSWRTDSSAGKVENVEIPAGNYEFFETEEGLLEAWERKILIFLQEKECFCGVLRSWRMGGSARRGGVIIK